MFGGNKREQPIFTDQVETVIGRDTQFKGTITSSGTIRVDGKLDGDLATTGDVVVGEGGIITASIKGRNATLAGMVSGNMEVKEKLELLPTAKLFGDIKAGTLIIGEGAIFKGGCEMYDPVPGKSKENKGSTATA